jgi:hypothetical protein
VTIRITLILAIFILVCTSLRAQVPQEKWVARYDGPLSISDAAAGLVVDQSGNVYITGSVNQTAGNFDYATIKYNSNGVQQWVAIYNGTGNGNDRAFSIAIDNSGNVYITGESLGAGTNLDAVTIKYNSSGVQQWLARYEAGNNLQETGAFVTLDNSGNVYVTGQAYHPTQGSNYLTIKYNNSGVQQWVAYYDGFNGSDVGRKVVIDNSGNSYITGHSHNGTSLDYATLKYNSSGVQQWVSRYDGPVNGTDAGVDIALDGSGNVIVTGYSDGSGALPDWATIKYNSAGAQQWVTRRNGPGNSYDEPYALAVDVSGNVYVTGYNCNGANNTTADGVTIKYNSSGVQQWLSSYNGSGNGQDVFTSIAVDTSGNLYVLGYVATTGYNFVTIKYNSSGAQQWLFLYNGPGNYDVTGANSIVVDTSGSVYITGYSNGGASSNDYLTIKYSQLPSDFRTFQSGNWNNTSTWEMWNGSSWLNPAPHFPTSADSVITIKSGHTITVTADVTVNNVSIRSGGTVSINNGFNLINNGGILYDSGTISGAGTLKMQGSDTIIQPTGGLLSSQIKINTGTTIITTGSTGSCTFGGSLTVDTTATMLIAPGIILEQNGNVVVNGTLTCLTSAQFHFNGATFVNNGTVNIGTLYFGSGGNQNLNGNNGTIQGPVVIQNGTNLILNGEVTMNSVTINSGCGMDITNDTLGLTASGLPISVSGSFITTGSTIAYRGDTAQVVQLSNVTYNNLSIKNPAGVTLNAPLTIPGTLTLLKGVFNTGSNLTLSNGATIIRDSAGSLSVPPTFGAGVNIMYVGSRSINIGLEMPPIPTTLQNFTDKATGRVFLSSSITCNGTMSLDSGSLAIGNNTLTIRGNLINSQGKFYGSNQSNLIIKGPGLTYNSFGFSGGGGYLNNFTINRGSEVPIADNLVLNSDLVVQGTLTLAGGTLLIDTCTLTLNGPPIAGVSTNLLTNGSSNIVFGGSSQNVFLPSSVSSLNHLTIQNSSLIQGLKNSSKEKQDQLSTGVILNSNLTMNGNLTLSAGTFSMNGYSLTIKGAIVSSGGNLSGGTTSCISFIGNSPATTLPTVIGGLNNLTLNRPNGINLSGNNTVNGMLLFQAGYLNTGSDTLFLGSSALDSGETSAHYLKGNLKITIPNIGTGSSNFGNIGLSISSQPDTLGSVSVVRVSGPVGIISSNGNTGIAHNWRLTSANEPVVNGRYLTFSWVGSDNNGRIPAISQVWRKVSSSNFILFSNLGASGSDPYSISSNLTYNLNNTTWTVSDTLNPLGPSGIPTAPVLFSPSNNANAQLLSLPLLWNRSPQAITYRVQVATDPAFTSLLLNDSTVTDTVKIISGLNTLTNYWWRVNGKGTNGTGNYSSVFQFKTLGTPYGVTLLSPVNNATNQPLSLTFVWRNAIDQTLLFKKMKKEGKDNIETISKYWFELMINDTVTLFQRDTTLTDTTKLVNGLNYQTVYYWRVRAKNEIGYGAYSNWFKFTTIPLPPANVNLTIIPGGFYNPGTGQLTMKDTIKVYLIDSSLCQIVDSAKGVLDSVTFSLPISFYNAVTGNYYLFVYHRNHITIASKLKQSITRGSIVSYNFTTDSSKAYGYNMIKLSDSPARWGMIPGDANRDGYIDALDQLVWIDENGLDGYLMSDFNGDGYVDALDQLIWIFGNGQSYVLPCEFAFENKPEHSKKLNKHIDQKNQKKNVNTQNN